LLVQLSDSHLFAEAGWHAAGHEHLRQPAKVIELVRRNSRGST
jgi:hypothetical protein